MAILRKIVRKLTRVFRRIYRKFVALTRKKITKHNIDLSTKKNVNGYNDFVHL